MKKVGLLIFIAALSIGVVFGNVFSIGKIPGKIFNFSVNRGVKGSGNTLREKRAVSDFNGVDVGGIFQVEITAQKDFSVEIEADDNLLPLVKTEVRGGVLKLETANRISSKKSIKVRISAPNIESLEVSGASNVSLADAKNENLQIDASGASKVFLTGETSNLIADISGASQVDAENLKSQKVIVDASGASSINVFAVSELSGEASGASKIVYSGNPQELSKSTSGAGSIKQK